MTKKLFLNFGQNLMEYTIVLSVIVLVFLALNPMIKRSLQGMIKTAADQIGTQQNAEQEVNVEKGYVVDSFSVTDSLSKKVTKEGKQAGSTDIEYSDVTSTHSNSGSILGFTHNQE
jgi:hypothetical protein